MASIFAYFLVDPEALDKSYDVTNIHRVFLRLWHGHGVLVCPADSSDQERLLQEITKMPQALKTLWQKAWKANRKTLVQFHLPDLESLYEIERMCDFVGKANLLLLENTKADILADLAGCMSYNGSFFPPGIEIEVVRFKDSDLSATFEQAIQISNHPIPAGASVDAVWMQNFAPFLDMHVHIALVDHYALIEHDRHVDSDNKVLKSGIQRFLCELGAHEKPHSFKIIAATDSSASQSQDYFTSLLTGLVKDLNKGGIRRLEFHGLDKRQFSSQVHDRFIRFNRTVCTLGRGIEVLSGYSVKKLSDFSMKTNPKTVDEYRKVEEALETKAQCSVIYDADQVA